MSSPGYVFFQSANLIDLSDLETIYISELQFANFLEVLKRKLIRQESDLENRRKLTSRLIWGRILKKKNMSGH